MPAERTRVEDHRWSDPGVWDVTEFGNGRRVRAFLDDVVNPSLIALDRQIADWQERGGGAPFAIADIQALTRQTTQAFCLSIHSLFERQLRRWIAGAVHRFGPTPERIDVATNRRLEQLDTLLAETRGIALRAFDSWDDISLLELVADACRHGDGRSAGRLFKLKPHFWPPLYQETPVMPGMRPQVRPTSHPPMDAIEIPRDQLQRFVEAIDRFWLDVELIHCNSCISPQDAGGWRERQRLLEIHRARRQA
ncbi:hypothetical protein [Burkholderia sp. Ac-20365]|uniref:hypothetical protein n=1 Tax=Burkholderia sp. Ac-20365 TaxID=2703897 RepID=UPI00197BCC21|nr:hypothetical protein [Burkholderia sp. Ac-20365]MBN3761247.1 hypothetical protein [Burkholderia sp. Ac-20365]